MLKGNSICIYSPNAIANISDLSLDYSIQTDFSIRQSKLGIFLNYRNIQK